MKDTITHFRCSGKTQHIEMSGIAGKIARQEEFRCPSEFDDTFAKKFEVLFCGRVAVAHRKAPPALIDECIEGFSHVSGGFSSDHFRSALQPPGDGERGPRPMRKSFSQPGLRSLAFRKEFQDAGLRSSSFFSSFEESDIENHLISGHNIVQPTDIEENRTMLFTIGQSEVYLISPDTKKIALQKNFKEISFCSQGIRHVDHFGFICRESCGGGGFHFVCYVFQCANEALVDEIMMTLKQAFTVAALQRTAKAPAQLCDGCPLQGLHKLCERIEGELGRGGPGRSPGAWANSLEDSVPWRLMLVTGVVEGCFLYISCYHLPSRGPEEGGGVRGAEGTRPAALLIMVGMNSSKTKLELQKHLTTLTNQEQATIFEEVQTALCNFPPNSVKLRPRNEQRENELIISFLRCLYEEKQKVHIHIGEIRQEPSGCEKEASSVSESCFRLLGSSDDLSSDSESQRAEEPGLPSPQQGLRRRANTLGHVPVDCQEPPQPARGSPGVLQRKLVRYHSVSTETPHERK
ncbi:TBC1D1 [Cervus elaphus hippelaphus]|uniref:TBC1D1 n=1 Tax=Cervus elaphus hippelaphus TaxID=46360 RepID=A0A212CM11_CEREH|nr:TBC1D1 [Cervus elaphus hippelaphus]